MNGKTSRDVGKKLSRSVKAVLLVASKRCANVPEGRDKELEGMDERRAPM